MLFFLIGLLLSAAGLVMSYQALRPYRRALLKMATPTSTPGAVSLGRSEVVGTAQPVNEPLSLPHEDRTCLLYAYYFFHREREHDSGGYRWQSYEWGWLGVPFFLEGDQGRVYVDPADADIDFDSEQGDSAGDPPPSSVFWQAEEGPPAEIKDFVDQLDAFQEYRIDPQRHVEEGNAPDTIAGFAARKHHQMGERIEEKDVGKRALYVDRIDPGEELYLIGEAKPPDGEEIPDDVSAVFRETDSWADSSSPSSISDAIFSDSEFTLSISARSENELVASQRSASWSRFFGGIFLFLWGFGLMYWVWVAW